MHFLNFFEAPLLQMGTFTGSHVHRLCGPSHAFEHCFSAITDAAALLGLRVHHNVKLH